MTREAITPEALQELRRVGLLGVAARSERPDAVPPEARLLELPYSEVCCHMRVAGKRMWVEPVEHGMAQLYERDGSKFSFPITRGEAGLHERVSATDPIAPDPTDPIATDPMRTEATDTEASA